MVSGARYIMHIDDDTELPEDFVLDETVWADPRALAFHIPADQPRDRSGGPGDPLAAPKFQ